MSKLKDSYVTITFKEGHEPRAPIKGMGAYKGGSLLLKEVQRHVDYDEMIQHKVTKTKIKHL
jgi:hypothetical protein